MSAARPSRIALLVGTPVAVGAAVYMIVRVLTAPDPAGRCAAASALAPGERWVVRPAGEHVLSDDFSGECFRAGDGDVVRRIETPQAGRLTVRVEGAAAGPHLSMELLPADCTGKPVACGVGPGALTAEVPAGTWHLVVDAPPEGVAVVADLDTGILLDRLAGLKVDGPAMATDPLAGPPLGGGCLGAGRPQRAVRLDHAGGAVRIEVLGGVNPGALAVRRRCEADRAGVDGQAACVAAPLPVVDLPDLPAGPWCVVAEGDGDRTIRALSPGAPLTPGRSVTLRAAGLPGAGLPAAPGPACTQGGRPGVVGRFLLAAPGPVRFALEGDLPGVVSVVVDGQPRCGTEVPPELAADLPLGEHEVRVEGPAAGGPATVRVSAL